MGGIRLGRAPEVKTPSVARRIVTDGRAHIRKVPDVTNAPRWLIAILLSTLVFAAGCGGGSSGDGDTSEPAMAVEPAPEKAKPVTLKGCLTEAGFEVQRDADGWGVTRNGHTFTKIHEFGSVSEAVAYDQNLTIAVHSQIGPRVATGGSAADLKPVELCLGSVAQK